MEYRVEAKFEMPYTGPTDRKYPFPRNELCSEKTLDSVIAALREREVMVEERKPGFKPTAGDGGYTLNVEGIEINVAWPLWPVDVETGIVDGRVLTREGVKVDIKLETDDETVYEKGASKITPIKEVLIRAYSSIFEEYRQQVDGKPVEED